MSARKRPGIDDQRTGGARVALVRVLGIACCALLQGSCGPGLAEEPLREVAGVLEDVPAQIRLLPDANSGTWISEALRRRLTIPLPEEMRFLFPGEHDSLFIDPETLWLARCIYSESDRPHEQELIAWVVRNRVATHFRGKQSYRDVVLDPFQFSAFNPGSPHRPFYLSLMPEYAHPRWRRALLIAAFVRRAGWPKRPFPVTVRHFYSEVSMQGRHSPAWAERQAPVQPWRRYRVDPRRFRFFALSE